MATLQDYLNASRRLLHDAQGRYWSDADLTVSINDARKRVVADTTCYRALQTLYISSGLEVCTKGGVTGARVALGGSGYDGTSTITFSAPQTAGGVTALGTLQVTNGAVTDVLITRTGSGYTAAPTVNLSGAGAGASIAPTILAPATLDVMNLTIIWGQTRAVLNQMSWTEFQASIRGWVGYQQRPGIYAKYGQSDFYIGPIPDQTYVSEWDTVLVPSDLAATTDVCVIQYPYTDAVPFYAAHLAKLNEQSYEESDRFLQLYQRKCHQAIRSAQMRVMKSVYGS